MAGYKSDRMIVRCLVLATLVATAHCASPSPSKPAPSPTNPSPYQTSSEVGADWLSSNDTWAVTVKAQIDASNYTGAISTLETENAENPKNPDVLNMLGYCYRKKDNPDLQKSEDYYLQALAIDPNHCGALEYLGELYLTKHQVEDAEKQLDTLKAAEKCKGGEEEQELAEEIEKYMEQRALSSANSKVHFTFAISTVGMLILGLLQ